jgi:hypothetical protein
MNVNYLAAHYSLKGGYASSYFGLGPLALLWPINYADDLYYPVCVFNQSKFCDMCDAEGVQCYVKDTGQSIPVNHSGINVACIYL